MSVPKLSVINYREANAASSLLPKPSILSSGWSDLHLEVFQQPKFEIAEHQHTMHVLACGLPDLPDKSGWESQVAFGERWLDGKREPERRRARDIAIVPAGIAHRCNWNTSVQFLEQENANSTNPSAYRHTRWTDACRSADTEQSRSPTSYFTADGGIWFNVTYPRRSSSNC